MHIDIHHVFRQFQTQHAAGEPAGHELIIIGLFQCRRHQTGLDRTAIDKELLIIAVAAGGCGLGHKTKQAHILPLALHLQHIHRQLASVDLIDCTVEIAVTGRLQNSLAILDQPEGHLRMGQRLPLQGARHLGGFHRIPLHKLHAGRCIIEQIPHHDGGTFGAARRRTFLHHTGFQTETDAFRCGCLGQQIDFGHRGDGRQRLTAEAQRANGSQILFGAELAGGMA